MVDQDNLPPTETPDPVQNRRLIIIVVAPGEDPIVETDPPESFAAWELEAALKRACELVEEEDFLDRIKEEEDNDSD